MPTTHIYETDFQIGSKLVLVFAEYTFLKGGPETGPSYSSGGEPADPDEIEFVKVEINTTDTDAKTAKAENYFPAPDWLASILQNDDDVYQEICSQDHSYYPEYEHERD